MDPVRTADAGEDTASVSDLLVEFGGWLERQRGLAPITIGNYCWHAEQFLVALPGSADVSVGRLDAGTVTGFMVKYCRDRNTNSAKSMARSLRSFLRFAHATVGRLPSCGAQFRRRRAGTWRRCRRLCRQRTSNECWLSPGVRG